MVKSIRFARNQSEFFTELNARVNDYFTSNQIKRKANAEMVFKTIFMLSLYTIPYALMIFGVFQSVWVMWLLYLIMGFGMSGIGLSIMHDANHGSYSSRKWLNTVLGYTLNVVGCHAFNWKVQHNVLHHTYTNVHDHDEDIDTSIIRMAPGVDWKPIHRWQHIYAWFLYSLLTFVWILQKDFINIIRYQREGLVKLQKANIFREWIILVATKIFYIGYMIVLPVILLPHSFWQVFLGFFISHAIAGFILSIIFQPAHVIEGTEYPVPNQEGTLENTWAIHQLHTTTNFGHKHKLFSWYIGGLNYQVEHHLFPGICHVHYRNIAPIVRETAEDFGLPYKSKNTFFEAVAAHGRLLKALGKKDYGMVPVKP